MKLSTVRRKVNTMLHTPRVFMKKFQASPVFKHLPDDLALKIMYKNIFLKDLDLENPQTFNEKLQWLKLYNRKPEYAKMVDKYEAKKYVASIIGEEHIIPTYGVWKRFDDIDFNELPNQFVLKCTHGSGDVVVCKDKSQLDMVSAKIKLEKSLKTDYYKIGREWPYKKVEPQIIAEQFMQNSTGTLNDYKFMCFNGNVKCSFVCSGRFTDRGLHVTFFDREWNVLPFERDHPHEKSGLPKPEKYEDMLRLAEKLSEKLPFARIDFYEIDGLIYFGEITFFPGGGFEAFQPEEWDYTLGSWIELSKV